MAALENNDNNIITTTTTPITTNCWKPWSNATMTQEFSPPTSSSDNNNTSSDNDNEQRKQKLDLLFSAVERAPPSAIERPQQRQLPKGTKKKTPTTEWGLRKTATEEDELRLLDRFPLQQETDVSNVFVNRNVAANLYINPNWRLDRNSTNSIMPHRITANLYDVFIIEDVFIPSNSRRIVDMGFDLCLSPTTCAHFQIVINLCYMHGLVIGNPFIDSTQQAAVLVLFNHSEHDVMLKRGTNFARLYIKS